jgi:NAD(P)H-hydrate repair Nnr-like enzyme with NAD(P)H-hydrate dehydratase domain
MAGPEEARPFVAAAVSRLPAAATLVLDALALTCGIADADELSKVAARTVITPNDTEARRILDDDAISSSGMGKVLAQQLGVVTVLGTTVATPDGRSFQVQKGNVGLATSGSGDVLAGAIAGLAARGATPLQAALWGLALHSGAGDRLAHRIGPVGYLARELLDELPLMLATEL